MPYYPSYFRGQQNINLKNLYLNLSLCVCRCVVGCMLVYRTQTTTTTTITTITTITSTTTTTVLLNTF